MRIKEEAYKATIFACFFRQKDLYHEKKYFIIKFMGSLVVIASRLI